MIDTIAYPGRRWLEEEGLSRVKVRIHKFMPTLTCRVLFAQLHLKGCISEDIQTAVASVSTAYFSTIILS